MGINTGKIENIILGNRATLAREPGSDAGFAAEIRLLPDKGDIPDQKNLLFFSVSHSRKKKNQKKKERKFERFKKVQHFFPPFSRQAD
jgi:hypothetical protein